MASTSTPVTPAALAGDAPAVQMKACSKCKQVKPAAQSFWKDPTKKSGYTSWCKACFSESAERRKLDGPPVIVTERECSICKKRKPADAFMKDSRRITGLDARCRECRRAQHAARKQRNIEAGNVAWKEKECKRCHIVKPASDFKRHAYTASGLVGDVTNHSSSKYMLRSTKLAQDLSELMGNVSIPVPQKRNAEQSNARQETGWGISALLDSGDMAGFAVNPDVDMQDSWCKQCCCERRKELQAQKAALAAGPAPPTAKECTSCNEVKPASDFAKDKGQAMGLSRRCKTCEKDYRRSKRQCTTPPTPGSPRGGLSDPGLGTTPTSATAMAAAAAALQDLMGTRSAGEQSPYSSNPSTPLSASPATVFSNDLFSKARGSWPGTSSVLAADNRSVSPIAMPTAGLIVPGSAGAVDTSAGVARAPTPPARGRVSAFAAGSPALPSFAAAHPFQAAVQQQATASPAAVPQGWVVTGGNWVETKTILPPAAPLQLSSANANVGGSSPMAGSPTSNTVREPSAILINGQVHYVEDCLREFGRADSMRLPSTLAAELTQEIFQGSNDARRVESLLGSSLPAATTTTANTTTPGENGSLAPLALPGAERGTSFSFSLVPGFHTGRFDSLLGGSNAAAFRIDSILGADLGNGFDNNANHNGQFQLPASRFNSFLAGSSVIPSPATTTGVDASMPVQRAASRGLSILQALAAGEPDNDNLNTTGAASRVESLFNIGDNGSLNGTASRVASLFSEPAMKTEDGYEGFVNGGSSGGGAWANTPALNNGATPQQSLMDLERFGSLGLTPPGDMDWSANKMN